MPPPENPTFSTKKEKYGGGISKNESKVGFSGGASAGVPAQVAGLSFSHSARNRFEFRCTKEPNCNFCAARAATDGRHAVPSIGFSGGKTEILGVRSTLFCFAAAFGGI